MEIHKAHTLLEIKYDIRCFGNNGIRLSNKPKKAYYLLPMLSTLSVNLFYEKWYDSSSGFFFMAL
ncbi:MAG: hypothetical protein MRQ10_04730 [Candidatus Midichloria mitochondrii]|nr:hypothetical protein [Candidatus Midichloria mitochondrii]